ncbi:MAG: efflux RND transporter permease subunit [Deltaproteobacteria bacterium]|nr:efflux RND transporter permease subunit [Deltaproteobacteria bacterium]
MINRIIDFSVNNKFIVFAVVIFACIAGWWSIKNVALDAIPDLSDTQVIVYSRWDRSPDIVEDQVTYPIVTALLGAPHVKTVRGFSDFGYSYVYVIFDDDTDIYWARSRVQEYLATVLPNLPPGVRTELGPDATALGWVYQYVLVDETGKRSLAELRTLQDWYMRYWLKSVPGVAEVAPVGGFSKQYQVNVNPNRLQNFGIPIRRVIEAVRDGSKEVGGRLIELGGSEYMVRGRGYANSLQDFENIVLTATDTGTPIRIKDIGQVVHGPDWRRGIVDLDGRGEAVSGIVIMRHGQNALDVIERVKTRIKQLESGLPEGVKVVSIYDRSDLIRRAIDNLKSTIVEVILVVVLIILLFLWHFPSAVIPIITIPVAVLISFIPFRLMGVTANIMSLAGIAIAIGALVDASIVVVEQTHKNLEEWEKEGRRKNSRDVIVAAIKQVAGPSFFALLVIAVAFLPVLTLTSQEGKLFKPLAYTKNLSMIIAAVLAITLDPALRVLLGHRQIFSFRPRWLARPLTAVFSAPIRQEENHPLSRFLTSLYMPVLNACLRHPKAVIAGALVLLAATVPVYRQLGSEYMPPLEEGSILYMPTTVPGISITEAGKLLQITDRIIKQFPEVDRVLGKAGRADTATDPAPLSMLETLITLKPKDQWRERETWYSSWAPQWSKALLRRITPDRISQDDLIREMNEALKFPGLANAWTMPIKGRIEMLSTGLRTPVGIKISGSDLDTIEEIGAKVESALAKVRGTRGVFAEKTGSGYFLDFRWHRDSIQRYGLSMEEVQTIVAGAVGGENVTSTVEGRERYPVNVRYMKDFRSDLGSLSRLLIPVADGSKSVSLSQLADISLAEGPSMIRDEDGLLTGYVYVDIGDRDQNGYIEEASEILRKNVPVPAGFTLLWSGQYEATNRIKDHLLFIIPLTLFFILVLLYLNTRSLIKTFIILLAVPFSAIGALWFLYFLGYNMSTAVWVGLIALLGVDAGTGVFMLLYLDLAYERAQKEGRLASFSDLQEVIRYGAAKRLRPKFMTVAAMMIGLLPIMWSAGAGADVMKRIAAPLIGGILTSFLLELMVYPVVYQFWKGDFVLKKKLPAEVE